MLMDKKLTLFDAEEFTNLTTTVIDLSAAGDAGDELYLIVNVTTAGTDYDAVALFTNDTNWTGSGDPLTRYVPVTEVGTTCIPISGCKRYLRINSDGSFDGSPAGTIALVQGPQTNK